MFVDKRGYVYRSYRENGRVKREYIGSNDFARALANYSNAQQKVAVEEKKRAQGAFRSQLDQWDASDREVKAFYDQVSALLRSVLEASGYHQHARSEWRKKRIEGSKKKKNMAIELELKEALSAEGNKLLMQAQQGDGKASHKLCMMVKGTPNEDVIKSCGDAARQTIATLALVSTGKNKLRLSATLWKIEEMRAELLGPSPTALEELLVDRILACHLQVNRLELMLQASQSAQQEAHYDKRLNHANKRYLAAIKSLAQVRKLQLPNVQINVGEKQVNIGQMGAPK